MDDEPCTRRLVLRQFVSDLCYFYAIPDTETVRANGWFESMWNECERVFALAGYRLDPHYVKAKALINILHFHPDPSAGKFEYEDLRCFVKLLDEPVNSDAAQGSSFGVEVYTQEDHEKYESCRQLRNEHRQKMSWTNIGKEVFQQEYNSAQGNALASKVSRWAATFEPPRFLWKAENKKNRKS